MEDLLALHQMLQLSRNLLLLVEDLDPFMGDLVVLQQMLRRLQIRLIPVFRKLVLKFSMIVMLLDN